MAEDIPRHTYKVSLLSKVYFSDKQNLQILLITCFLVKVMIGKCMGHDD